MKTTTKKTVYMTLPIIGYIHCKVELDIPTNISDEEDIEKYILRTYSTDNIINNESFETEDVDYTIDEEDNKNRAVLEIE